MHRHNWRKAASYIYSYSVRLRAETAVKDHQVRSSNLQERLNGLAAAINALQLVHPSYAWIDAPIDNMSPAKETYPNKKARISKLEQCRAFFTMNLDQEIVVVLDQWIWGEQKMHIFFTAMELDQITLSSSLCDLFFEPLQWIIIHVI